MVESGWTTTVAPAAFDEHPRRSRGVGIGTRADEVLFTRALLDGCLPGAERALWVWARERSPSSSPQRLAAFKRGVRIWWRRRRARRLGSLARRGAAQRAWRAPCPWWRAVAGVSSGTLTRDSSTSSWPRWAPCPARRSATGRSSRGRPGRVSEPAKSAGCGSMTSKGRRWSSRSGRARPGRDLGSRSPPRGQRAG